MHCLMIDLTDAPGAWGKVMLADMAKALSRQGVAVTAALDAASAQTAIPAFLAALEPEQRFLLIDGNCRANKMIRDPRALRFSFMVDHPAYHIANFVQASTAMLLGFVDESHLEAADRFGLPFPKLFFPHAGPEPDSAPEPIRDRPIDLLISASLEDPLSDAAWRAANPGVPEIVASALLDAADQLSTTLTTCLAAWDDACRRRGFDHRAALTIATLCQIIATIERIASARRRQHVLAGLPEALAIHVVTPKLPAYLAGHPGLVSHGPAPFSTVIGLMKHSKILVNCLAKYSRGSHERIWYAMAAGCVVATDQSRFLERDFSHRYNILFLPWGPDQQAFRHDLVNLVRNSSQLTAIHYAAMPIYARHHSWDQRVEPLVALLRQAS